MPDVFIVKFTKDAGKQTVSIPQVIAFKLNAWVDSIRTFGLRETKKHPGFHDHSLKSPYKNGERAVSLNRSWRAVYIITKDNKIEIVLVTGVHNHDYKK